ncbi:4-hydroxythreonine-4-phosphate dehydrogenase [Roseibium hamelinense]|uniref:4-hydroxythreonine-4-phosphate dehydrogenase n=1 Tax=Roseibium hamelinense TaxID=150831 RepID=A0A562TJ19_9HYPH|nr:4-hydroxythreonine-4-phosphate dehydrogenase PdxA [Roseibium hamelinense]MTI42317.1 4-hydroxythreonine-4-phosphate dehydrogenase PdxA [Roseibium hamelinense]TWI93238.1 4-hydroxythreonine-4-phosphate dehydrogenase [Roseibium hamelinense]
MISGKKPLVVTCGEPAGIGPDITLMAWLQRKDLALPPFYIRSDPGFLSRRAERMGLEIPVQACNPEDARSVFKTALPVVLTGDPIEDRPGEEQASTARAVLQSIEQAVEDVARGAASAVVTNPINKAALYDAGFDHPGHTEYLGALAETHWPDTIARPVMMIAGPELMVVPVTIHIPLKDVPSNLTEKLILDTARIAAADLKSRFGIAEPRLVLAGLNPHAGEDGKIGTEDRDVIAPAVAKLRDEGIDARGPLPADTLFHPQARKTFDCVLGMYHDQVLVPAKTIGFDDSVNVTLGLPFVRTSPDHGTAYDIAGTGKARLDSFAAALRMAGVLSNPGKF